jgi:hypothetical protein
MIIREYALSELNGDLADFVAELEDVLIEHPKARITLEVNKSWNTFGREERYYNLLIKD